MPKDEPPAQRPAQRQKRTTTARKRRTRRAEQRTTPAEEWGQRRATGKIIESGGHEAGIDPAERSRRDKET